MAVKEVTLVFSAAFITESSAGGVSQNFTTKVFNKHPENTDSLN